MGVQGFAGFGFMKGLGVQGGSGFGGLEVQRLGLLGENRFSAPHTLHPRGVY